MESKETTLKKLQNVFFNAPMNVNHIASALYDEYTGSDLSKDIQTELSMYAIEQIAVIFQKSFNVYLSQTHSLLYELHSITENKIDTNKSSSMKAA